MQSLCKYIQHNVQYCKHSKCYALSCKTIVVMTIIIIDIVKLEQN